MSYYVYKHTSPSNKVYIGITQNCAKRWRNGLGYLKNKYFYSAIQKYGWDNFTHEILFDNLTKEQAEQKEIELIAFYKSNQRAYGYNHATGGSVNSGYKLSDETKKKLSDSHKGQVGANKGKPLSEEHNQKLQEGRKRYIEKYGHPLLGKHCTKETKQKISRANKGKSRIGKDSPWYGKHFSESHKQKISSSLSGREFSDTHKLNLSKSAKGKVFTKEHKQNLALSHDAQSVRIVQIDKTDNSVIQIWESIGTAARNLGIHRNYISRCLRDNHKCKNGNFTSGGFIWKYYDDLEVD